MKEVQREVQSLLGIFTEVFGPGSAPVIVRAPGRVNLIGEHTDYNEGFVLPVAVDFSLFLAARRRKDRQVKAYAVDREEMAAFSLEDQFSFDHSHTWSNYLQGVLRVLQEESGEELPGIEVAFTGKIPPGAGLSSSAALEVAAALALQELNGLSFDRPALARICQRAENEFAGVNCGIMDQFISLLGKAGHALFLDCRSLEYRQLPLELGEYRLILCQSGVRHTLADSEYNRRRRECEEGVAFFSQRFPEVKSLRDLTLTQLEAHREELNPVIYRRLLHVLSENLRVEEGVAALEARDFKTFGVLMNASHDSLRYLYEVSCAEIDLLVGLAREVPGVLGTRLTGGGFGGSTISLVQEGAVEDFSRRVLNNYQQQTGITPVLYEINPAGGAELIEKGEEN
ncbi:MAG: galactokinase [Firmicutes bacterium]|nr:galactokinase [Bacillota bacterium]